MFRKSGGFSLVEMAVLLVIFGGLAAASTMLGSKWVEGTEVQTTRSNIETIEKAIDAYVRLNQRLPCPAPSGVAASDAAFGRDTSAADGLCSNATLASGQVVKGVVPFQTLGVGKSLAYDAWGNRLDYYVDRRTTAEDAFINLYPVGDATIGDIEVQDMAGGQRTNKAVMAIVSHGARGHGAVNRSGTTLSLTDPNAKEVENANTDRILVQGITGKGADGREFDDLVFYKTRSQLATSGVNASVSCPAQAVNWTVGADSCGGAVGELAAGEAVLVSDLSAPATGSVVVRCLDNETLTQSSASCAVTVANCAAATVNWTVDAACSGSAPATVHGASTGAVANTTGGRTGSASFSCNDGVYSVLPGSVCGNNCTAGTANWGSCTQSYGAFNHGASTMLTDSTLVDTGNVTVTCSNGTVSQSGASCNVSGCGAATLSWGGSCSANIAGPEANGFSAGVTNTASGYAGSATATCTAGAWVLSSTSCNAHCAAQTVNWTVSGQTCTQSVGALSHGNNSTISDAVQNSTGSVTVTCNNGTLGQSAATCVTQCPAGTANWTVGASSCDAATALLAHGANTTATDATAPTTGTATVTCNNGVYNYSGTTCATSAASCTLVSGRGCNSTGATNIAGPWTIAMCEAACSAHAPVGTARCCDFNAATNGPCRVNYADVNTYGAMADIYGVSCTGAADTTPDAFSFTDVTGQALNTLITSNTITISGINVGTAVSVSGAGSPEISINGGAWATSGTITNGQTLAVRLTSSGSNSTARTATVDVGGVTDVWTVTTTAVTCSGMVGGRICTGTPSSVGMSTTAPNCMTACVMNAGGDPTFCCDFDHGSGDCRIDLVDLTTAPMTGMSAGCLLPPGSPCAPSGPNAACSSGICSITGFCS